MVLPVLSLLLFGIIQLGVTLNNYILVANAAAAGERALSTNRGTPTPYTATKTAIDDALPAAMVTKMAFTTTVNTTACTTDAGCETLYPSSAGVDPSTVTVTYPCNLTFWTIKFSGCTITSASTEIIQ